MFSHSYAFLDAKKGGFTKKCKRFVKNYNALQPEFSYFAAHSYMYGGTKKDCGIAGSGRHAPVLIGERERNREKYC
jgi:hypothetical protein